MICGEQPFMINKQLLNLFHRIVLKKGLGWKFSDDALLKNLRTWVKKLF